MIYEFLVEEYENVEIQSKFIWCKNLLFDFLLKKYKIIIELDGGQHFVDVPHWNSIATEVQQNDRYKMQRALDNDYTMIRIYQPDVLHNKIDWKFQLRLVIEAHKRDMYCLSYIASDMSIYDNHIFSELEKIN